MKKTIKIGTRVLFFGEEDVFIIEGIYRRAGVDALLVEGVYETSGKKNVDLLFINIYAIVTPLDVKDKNKEWVRLISEIDHK
jgi:hypothetical protein